MRGHKVATSVIALLVLCTAAMWAGVPQEPGQERQADVELVVPAGTVIPIVLTAYLNSRSTQVGDALYADTAYPIWIQQRLILPKGSTVRGTVTEVVRPGRIKGKARMAIRFDDILLPNGVKRNLVASFRGIHGPGEEKIDRKSETVEAGSSKGTDVGTVMGSTSEGAIIGAVSGGGKGAGIGAGAGAAVGLATVLISRGRDLVLNPGTQFDLELNQPMRFAFGELQFTNAQLDNAERTIRSAPRTREPNRPPDYYPGRFGLPFPY